MKPILPTALIATLLLTGCGPSNHTDASPLLKKLTGKYCIVQFNRQALGAANDLPIPPQTGAFNGAETCVGGTLKKYDAEWLVLEKGKTDIYIPMKHVLLIERQP